MAHAFANTAVLDLWGEPRYNSERVSQLLWAEIVRTEERQDRFTRVVQTDGYTGWADHRFLTQITAEEAQTYTVGANWVVAASQIAVVSAKSEVPTPHRITYGVRLVRKGLRSGRAVAMLPDGAQFYVPASSLKRVSRRTGGQAALNIISDARRFLGVPYLWGGKSPYGFDCSGFVQLLFGRNGIVLPRDTKDQIRVGDEIDRPNVRKGDLLFFDRHVGIAIDSERFIHASVGGNGVRVNSLASQHPNYRPDLDRDFKLARRVL